MPDGASSTRVEVAHGGLVVHGDRAGEVYAAIDSPNGWTLLLSRFGESVGG